MFEFSTKESGMRQICISLYPINNIIFVISFRKFERKLNNPSAFLGVNPHFEVF